MKSKLKLLTIIVPCLSVVIATALAQAQTPTSTSIQRNSAQGEGSSSANPEPTPNPFYSGSYSVSEPDPQYISPLRRFSQATTMFGHTNDWRVHNEEAAIAPLVQQLKAAKSDSEVEKIKGQLDEALEKSFLMRQKRHTQEIEDLEAKVKTLKELVAKRQEKRREIVANRREQILRDAQGLGW